MVVVPVLVIFIFSLALDDFEIVNMLLEKIKTVHNRLLDMQFFLFLIECSFDLIFGKQGRWRLHQNVLLSPREGQVLLSYYLRDYVFLLLLEIFKGV